MQEVTVDELKRLLHYDSDTGLFTWNRPAKYSKNYRAGKVAGCFCRPYGYVLICIRGRNYMAHRLAWLYVYGEWPKKQIDHINADKKDNRIANLRDVTCKDNQQNKALPERRNSHGFMGATRLRSGRWRASIKVDGKTIGLGSFDTPDEASAAYFAAKMVHHKAYAERSAT